MADDAVRMRRRRRRRRRRIVVLSVTTVTVLGAAGTAWAMRRSDGPVYRLASATRADVAEAVDADGTLSARDTATLSFGAGGTVDSVRVRPGDRVKAGQTLATLDKSSLRGAVAAARTTLAQARQTLADDEAAQASGSSSSSSSSSPSGSSSDASAKGAESDSSVRLTSARSTPSAAPSTSKGSAASDPAAAVERAQHAVVTAQHALDAALSAQDAAIHDTSTGLAAECATGQDSITSTVAADANGVITGSVGAHPSVVTLDGGAGGATTQNVAAGGSYTFDGLTAGATYRLEVVRTDISDTDGCMAAVNTVTRREAEVDSAYARLKTAMRALDEAVNALLHAQQSNSSGDHTQPGGSTSSGTVPTGQASPSPSATSGDSSDSSGGTITAAQIAADQKAIDAATAALAVAKQNLTLAELTSPISGTVASVSMAKGDSVSASSSSATITVMGSGRLVVDVQVSIADIDLVKIGQHADVTVDGRSEPLAGTVTLIGIANSSDSSGSSSTYTVTVQLDRRDAHLYDGMGASVAIKVGTAKSVLTVPVSALRTSGTRHTVEVYEDGRISTKQVTIGVVGDERVQIKSGLSAGDRVVLAEVSADIPSDSNSPFDRSGSSLGGALSGDSGRVPVVVGPVPNTGGK